MTTVLRALTWYYLALRHTVHWLLGSPGRGQFWNELITFIISLFSDNVHFYEVHNSGGWYNFGFLLGASSALGGSGASASKSRS
jgi:hypothetical protein